eukprot:762818-Hanusia_phi.AAC.1
MASASGRRPHLLLLTLGEKGFPGWEPGGHGAPALLEVSLGSSRRPTDEGVVRRKSWCKRIFASSCTTGFAKAALPSKQCSFSVSTRE